MYRTLKQIKRLLVGIIGTTVLIIGLLLLVLPGPAIIVIPLGLAILATEFVWARRLMEFFRRKAARQKSNGRTPDRRQISEE